MLKPVKPYDKRCGNSGITRYQEGSWPVTRFGLILLFLFTPGCVDQTVQDGKIVFQYATWTGLLSLAGVVSLCILGLLRVATATFPRSIGGWLALIVGAGLLLGVIPGLFTDQIILTDDGFIVGDQEEIRFEETGRMLLVSQGNNREKEYLLICVNQKGEETRISHSDLIAKAIPLITEKARAKGVEIEERVE